MEQNKDASDNSDTEFSHPSTSKAEVTWPRKAKSLQNPGTQQARHTDWTEDEKMKLAIALQKYGHLDVDKLHKDLPTYQSWPGKLWGPEQNKGVNMTQSQTIADDTSLNKSLQLSIAHLADSLHRLLYKMGGRAEVYAMGHLSNLVAGEISRRRHGLCVSQALAHPISQMFDYMSGAEKVLLQSLSLEDGKAPVASDKAKEMLSQVEMMIRSRRDRGFTINAILALLVHLFALPLAPVDYDPLKDAARETLLDNFEENEDDATKRNFMLGGYHSSVNENQVFKILENIAKAREGLKKYRTLYSQEYSQRTVTLRPLLAQLAADIFNPSFPPIPDLVCVASGFGQSAGIKGLLRSSLGHLMSAARPTPPGEAKMVLVFVIGGITGEEVRLIREALWSVKDKAALAAAPKTVLIGGTRILTPDDVLHSLFEVVRP